MHVVLDVCTGEDVILGQECLQDFGEVTASGIEDLEHKDTSAHAQLQDGSREGCWRFLCPIEYEFRKHTKSPL